MGEKVASELCTIYDAGTVEHDRGALNFDDEGSLTGENVLIERGTLRGYMHDRISADYYKLNPTGNGRRESYAHYPLPRMTTTYLANGDTDPEDIIRSVKKEFTVLHSVAVKLTFPTGILFLFQPLHGL